MLIKYQPSPCMPDAGGYPGDCTVNRCKFKATETFSGASFENPALSTMARCGKALAH